MTDNTLLQAIRARDLGSAQYDAIDQLLVTLDATKKVLADLPDPGLGGRSGVLEHLMNTYSRIVEVDRAFAETAEADDDGCPGHVDDHTLLSGVGIGEATYCDGTCQR